MSQTQRMAILIQAVEDAQKDLTTINESKWGAIDEGFIYKLKIHLDSNNDSDDTGSVLISSANAHRSIVMNKYFVQHKKFLARYGVSGNLNITDKMNKQRRKERCAITLKMSSQR